MSRGRVRTRHWADPALGSQRDRIVLHWLSDVIGGALLAGVFVSLGAALMPVMNLAPDQERRVRLRR